MTKPSETVNFPCFRRLYVEMQSSPTENVAKEKTSNACDAFSSVHVKSVENVCEMLYILTQNRLENLTDSSLLLSLF